MRILLLEPDALLAQTYKVALESAHAVEWCVSAQAAVLAADANCPDLVVVELQLAGHNGIEFLYEFRSYPDWQNIPVVALTHVPAREFAMSWDLLTHGLGVRAYLYKPQTSLRVLLRTVNGFAPAGKTA